MQSLQNKLTKKAYKLDRAIRLGLDRVLPRNITVRFIAALTLVAALVISGQIVIQASLEGQSENQRKLRDLESLIHNSETLRKSALLLQETAKLTEIHNLRELITSFSIQLQKDQEVLRSNRFKLNKKAVPQEPISVTFQRAQANLTDILKDIQFLGQGWMTDTGRRQKNLLRTLLNLEAGYHSSLEVISKYYGQQLEEQTIHVKRIELYFLLSILFILAIEGLYIFRPGVEDLYHALRIRSDFLGRMGHEMRNPMNSILGMTNLLNETPLTPQQKKYLSILQRSSTGLLEILNNLLDFSSIESGTLKMENTPFDFYNLLEKSIDLAVYGAHANGVELILDLGTNVPLKLNGDPVRLQQILNNLLGNAVKFTKKGEVRLKVELQGLNETAWIQFSVIDTGMGIDKKKVYRIFEAFVQEDLTVRRKYGGTGLGLSISKDLVSLLGGILSVESQKNRGSRFYFSLPFHVSQLISVENTIQSLNLGSYKALIIEPNETVSNSITNLIMESGGEATQLHTTQDLSTLTSQLTQQLSCQDVIILDYEFSKVALPNLFTQIRRGILKTDSFVFLIKTTASSEDIANLAEYGIRNFLFKPVKPIQLLEAIALSLPGKVSISSQVTLEPTFEATSQKSELVYDSRALRILAVDDSKDNQFLVKAYLASLPYRVTFADNGRIAVEKAKASQFDLILMDLQMPEMDGYTATETIRKWETSEQLSPTPIIAVSAQDNESGSERFRKSRFTSYLLKPISPGQLRQTILNFTSHIQCLESTEEETSSLAQNDVMSELERQIAELAPQYLKNRRQELEEVKVLLSEANFEKIESLGHKLKGNAKSYGFEELGVIGMRFELAAQNRDRSELSNLIQQTDAYLSRLKESELS